MQVWNVLHAARWKYRTQKWCKNRHLCTTAQLCRAISSQLRHVSTIGKNLLSINISPTCPYNMVNFSLLAAEIISLVWGTQLISTGFASWQRYCTATLRRWTDGATCIRQGGHHVGHWPTFLVLWCIAILQHMKCFNWYDWVVVLRPTRHKIHHFGDVTQYFK